MRKLKLYNYNKTSYIDFNNNKYLVTDISGLGTSYEFKKLEKAIYDIEQSFENISLTVNFGIKSNAYVDYKTFLDFIALNGKKKFILGYDYGVGERFTDVYVKNIPKTQKTNFNIITENVVFDRLTPWYVEIEVVTPGDGNPYELDIVNNHIMPIPLKIETTGDVEELDLKLHYAGEFSRNLLRNSQNSVVYHSNNTVNYPIQYTKHEGYSEIKRIEPFSVEQLSVYSNTIFEEEKIVVGETYTESVDVRTVGQPITLIYGSYSSPFVFEILPDRWVRISRQRVFPSAINQKVTGFVSYDIPLNQPLYYRNHQLEIGDIATAWFPAPEDYDSEVGRVKVILESGYSLLIDSENKKVEFVNSSGTINGYDNIDHTYNTFLHINRGAHVLKDENGLPLKISYKKWVAD